MKMKNGELLEYIHIHSRLAILFFFCTTIGNTIIVLFIRFLYYIYEKFVGIIICQEKVRLAKEGKGIEGLIIDFHQFGQSIKKPHIVRFRYIG
jgi:hypothetical protein